MGAAASYNLPTQRAGIAANNNKAIEVIMRNRSIAELLNEIKVGMHPLKMKDFQLNLSACNIGDDDVTYLLDCIFRDEFFNKIRWLNLQKNNITSIGAKEVFKRLKNDSSINALFIAGNDIDDACINDLIELVSHNTALTRLILGTTYLGNKISDVGIAKIAEELPDNISLLDFDFGCNKNITDASLQHLTKIVKSTKIENMELRGTSISNKKFIFTYLMHNRMKAYPSKILISDQEFNDEDLIKLCDLIKEYGKNLQVISISRTQITSESATKLFEVLQSINSIASINISECFVGDECMEALAKLVSSYNNLVVFCLTHSSAIPVSQRVSDKGIDILLTGLIGNTTLKDLDFSYSALTDDSVPALQEICQKSCVERIKLVGTNINPNAIREIEVLLRIPDIETDIPLNSTTKSAAKRS